MRGALLPQGLVLLGAVAFGLACQPAPMVTNAGTPCVPSYWPDELGSAVESARLGTIGASAHAASLPPTDLVLADFDGDRDLDVAYVGGIDRVGVLLTGAGGLPEQALAFPTGGSTVSLAAADLDRDGAVDLLTANFTGSSVSVLYGLGNGAFALPSTLPAGRTPNDLAVADFDLDGNLDFAVADQNGQSQPIFLGNGARGFEARPFFSRNVAVRVAVEDFNGDGWPDLAAPDGIGYVSVHLGADGGTFRLGGYHYVGGAVQWPRPYSICAADFNEDLRLDLAVGTLVGTVITLDGDGDGGFGVVQAHDFGGAVEQLACVDLGRDGHMDVVGTAASTSELVLLLGRGDGSFEPRAGYSPGGQARALAAGDLDGDGRLDLALGVPANLSSIAFLIPETCAE